MTSYAVNLQGKTCVITGGGGVLCSVFAEAMASCGAKVAILDLRQDKAEAVAKTIRSHGKTALGIGVDVLDRNSLEASRERIRRELGPCSILVNGAGGNHPRGTTTREFLKKDDLDDKDLVTFFDLDVSGVRFVLDLNFLGTLLPCQVFAKDMMEAGEGTVINISSMSAFTPLTRIPAYSAAKAAVSNFTQWLAVHLSRVGIRVNAIAPGFFITDQNQSLLIGPDGSHTPRAEKILSHTPMGRFGKPEELVGTLLWLADSDSSGFVNGTVIPVDGGFSAYSGV